MGSPKEFHGGVFAQSLPGGRASARIFVLPEGLRASTPDGLAFELAFDSLCLELGGASGRMMFCRNADKSVTLFCEERGFIFALTRIAGKHLTGQIAPMRTRLRRQWFLRAAGWTFLACAAMSALWAVPPFIRWGLQTMVHTVPVSVDQQLGGAAMAAMDLGGPPARQPDVEIELAAMIERLNVTKEPFRFATHLVQRDVVNAFSLPGGAIVVYTGLLQQAGSAEAVAAVLAHEMGHVIGRHGLERIAQSMGLIATMHFFFGDVGGMLAVGREVLTIAAVNHYSRADEDEADQTAVKLLHAAHINPLALAEFFERLEKNPATPVPTFSWVSDHPSLPERAAKVRAAAAELPQQSWQPLPKLAGAHP